MPVSKRLASLVKRELSDEWAEHVFKDVVGGWQGEPLEPIGPYHLMIAATALANELTLVSANTREFSRVVGLSIENWEIWLRAVRVRRPLAHDKGHRKLTGSFPILCGLVEIYSAWQKRLDGLPDD